MSLWPEDTRPFLGPPLQPTGGTLPPGRYIAYLHGGKPEGDLVVDVDAREAGAAIVTALGPSYILRFDHSLLANAVFRKLPAISDPQPAT